MFCTFCGAENPEYAKFCRKCGSGIEFHTDNSAEASGATSPDAHASLGVEVVGPPTHEAPNVELDVSNNGYSHQYKLLTTDELLSIDSARDQLTPQAKQSLAQELATRHSNSELVTSINQPSTPERPIEVVVSAPVAYASLTDRFLAYCADVVVVYFILILVYFASGLLRAIGKPAFLSEDAAEAQIVYFVVLCFYMTLALNLYHTTIGKYAMGLEVAAEQPVGTYPSFWRILLRETLGRLLSSLFFGIGYWKIDSKERKQAFSDEIAGTVVQVRKVNRTLKLAFSACIFIALIADVGAFVYGIESEEHQKNHKAWEQQLTSQAPAVQAARAKADKILNTKPADLTDWQANMMTLLPALDDYDRQLKTYESVLEQGKQQKLYDSENEGQQVGVLLKVFELRKQQSAKQREEANLILKFDPSISDLRSFKSDLGQLDSDIEALDRKASELLAQIGIK